MGYFKILIIGEIGSGKSSLVYRIAYNSFCEKYKATIGCEFSMKSLNLDGEDIKVQLWDLAGQDRLETLARIFCRDASGAIVVADLADSKSLDKVPMWKNSVDNNSLGRDGNTIPMILCLNKVDLIEEQNQPDDSMLENLAKQHGFLKAICTSAKTGENIEEALEFLIRNVKHKEVLHRSMVDSIILHPKDHSQMIRSKKCC